MPEILKANSSADFLAAVPAITGYRASNSVVCVTFTGNRTAGVFRIDLPQRKRTSDYRALATHIIGMLARMRHVNRVTPVIYTDDTFEGEKGIPWLEFGRMLTRRIHGEGYHLPGAFCVAADGWGDYFETDGPRDGHPLKEINESPMVARAAEAGAADVPSISDAGKLPEVDAEQAKLFAETLAAVAAGELDRELDELADRCAVCWVELCLNWEGEEVPLAARAHLLTLAQSPAVRDAMMLQVAFGEEAGIESLELSDRYTRIRRITGETMDEVAGREIAAGDNDYGSTQLMGETTERPNVERVRRAITLLAHITALAPERMRPAPLCMLAWLSWSLGHGSAAGAHVDAALAIDPNYGMAQVLFTLFSGGRLPQWAFNGPTSVD